MSSKRHDAASKRYQQITGYLLALGIVLMFLFALIAGFGATLSVTIFPGASIVPVVIGACFSTAVPAAIIYHFVHRRQEKTWKALHPEPVPQKNPTAKPFN